MSGRNAKSWMQGDPYIGQILSQHGAQIIMQNSAAVAAAVGGVAIMAGPNFRNHFLDHKALLRPITGKNYRTLKEGGPEFFQDLTDLVDDGTLVFDGVGNIPGGGTTPALVYRGQGVTLVTKMDGEFWTLLKTGERMEPNIQMVPYGPQTYAPPIDPGVEGE